MDINLLKEKIDEYLEADESRDFIIGNETSELMAKSALSVLEAIRESQKYGVQEGYFKE